MVWIDVVLTHHTAEEEKIKMRAAYEISMNEELMKPERKAGTW